MSVENILAIYKMATPEEKRAYWATLTPEQQRRGKHHIQTVKAIQAHYERFI